MTFGVASVLRQCRDLCLCIRGAQVMALLEAEDNLSTIVSHIEKQRPGRECSRHTATGTKMKDSSLKRTGVADRERRKALIRGITTALHAF